jgi:hypothetical protein
VIKDGSQMRFWVDKWLGNSPLSEKYPCLYNIVRHKQQTVVEVFSSTPLNFSWRRDLIGPKLTAWNDQFPRIANRRLTQEQDVFHWNLDLKGQFSVKSHYLVLTIKTSQT